MDPKLIRAIESVGEPDWTAVVQAIGAIVAIVVGILGFLFVWLQIRSLKQAMYSETHSKVYAEDFELIKLFVDKPYLRPYFYKNAVVEPSCPHEGEVETIAELWCCHFEHVMLQLDYLPNTIRQSWVDYARFLYNSSPAIRNCYESLRKEGVYIAEMDLIMKGGVTTALNQAAEPADTAIPASPSSTV